MDSSVGFIDEKVVLNEKISITSLFHEQMQHVDF